MDTARHYFQQRAQHQRERREAVRQQWLQRVQAAVADLAPRHPGVARVYLFGSLTQPGRFHSDSDIDLAVACDSLESESAFWWALEHALQRTVDMRPLNPENALFETVIASGQRLYERHNPGSDQ